MTALLTDIILVSLMVLTALMVLRIRNLLGVVALAGAYSLISAGMFVNLDAVDVAFTEAAVGAGISTVLFLAAISRLPVEEKASRRHHVLASLVSGLAGIVLLAAVLDLPPLGAPDAPAQLHVAPRYLAESEAVLHIPNVVTTVLASYRGFDTLGETIVIFTAGLGVLLLLGMKRRSLRKSARGERE